MNEPLVPSLQSGATALTNCGTIAVGCVIESKTEAGQPFLSCTLIVYEGLAHSPLKVCDEEKAPPLFEY
jgi:hypothetical protein